MATLAKKRLFLKQYTDSENTITEILNYAENKFVYPSEEFTTNNSAQIATYQQYVTEAESTGVINVLKKKLVQLQFPVQKGISQTEQYKSATLRGKVNYSESNLNLLEPEAIKLDVYDSKLIGKVPVIVVPNDLDFATIVCALSNRNEPKPIPQSMGATFIKGLNNWDRINTLRRGFLENNPSDQWTLFFRNNILPNRGLYQDQLIFLSTKPYSNVGHEVMGLDEYAWRSHSFKIRLAHECAHLFTLKYFGAISNNLHDELIADYAGITSVLGTFRSSWMMHFMGLENFPNYREGGRFQNYIGELSAATFSVLQLLFKRAVDNISKFDQTISELPHNDDYMSRVKSLCLCDLITMAMEDGEQSLMDVYESQLTAQV